MMRAFWVKNGWVYDGDPRDLVGRAVRKSLRLKWIVAGVIFTRAGLEWLQKHAGPPAIMSRGFPSNVRMEGSSETWRYPTGRSTRHRLNKLVTRLLRDGVELPRGDLRVAFYKVAPGGSVR